MISIKNLTVEVDGKKVLDDINLNIPKGEVHLLLGPNGSGKTSLMMSILGYPQYRIMDGSIFMNGEDVLKLDMTERSRLGMGLAEQRPPSIKGVKLRMLIDYLLNDTSEKWQGITDLIQKADMTKFLDRDINAGLSGGEIKKSELLLLLCRKPLFVMLDEPDSGVDLDSLELLTSMINVLLSVENNMPARRRTGLIITHSDRILESINVDKAHVMLDSQLVCSGNPQIIMNKIAESGFQSCMECKKDAG